jgi:hypothetical protein
LMTWAILRQISHKDAEIGNRMGTNKKMYYLPVVVNDMLSSPWVQAMSAVQFRWYFRLLCYAWTNKRQPCHLANDDYELMVLAGCVDPAEWNAGKKIVLDRFDLAEDGKWLTQRTLLERYAEAIASYDLHSAAGRLGGLASGAARRSNATAERSNHIQNEIQKEEPTPLASPAAQPALITLPLLNGREHPITREFLDEMARAYPLTEPMQEFRAMRAWLLCNKPKRKTRSGIERFVNNWLTKLQNQGGNHGSRRTEQSTHKPSRAKQIANNLAAAISTSDGHQAGAGGICADPEVCPDSGGVQEVGGIVITFPALTD